MSTMARTKKTPKRRQVEGAARAGKKKRRTKPGIKALREIRFYQQSTGLLLRKLPFQRFVRELCVDITKKTDFRWQLTAMLALQEAAEAYVVAFFRDSVYAMVHAKRKTLMPKDMRLVLLMRGQIHVNMGTTSS